MDFYQHVKQQLGVSNWTPIQQATMEAFSSHQEFILYSATGSGKTLAYLLPIINELTKSKSTNTHCLILAPTRELALQIEQVFKSIKSNISVTTCYGGHSIKIEKRNLEANPSVVIGTPGRIADLLRRSSLSLNEVSHFVIDEFDKCLQIGFLPEIEFIHSHFHRPLKSVFCSATYIEEFPGFIRFNNSKEINLIQENNQPKIAFHQLQLQGSQLETLCSFLNEASPETVIVFLNFRDDVDGLADYLLERDYPISSYHGGMEQDERERALIKFRNGSCPILICTDIGARGLDISEVKHIVHFQLPDKEDAFIHRNGRTARMHEQGAVYWFEKETANYQLPKAERYSIQKGSYFTDPEWTTVYFSAGKKDKINKIDLVGFICQKGNVDKSAIGMIVVLDGSSYVAIQTDYISQLLPELRKHKIKNQKVRIAISK